MSPLTSRRVVWRRLALCAASLLLSLSARPGFAQETAPTEARGAMSLTYQYINAANLAAPDLVIPTGPTDTHALNFAVDYAIGTRWTLNASLPLITKRYKGRFPHNPLGIIPPKTDVEFIDDGHYHTSFQDLHVGAHYRATSDASAVSVAPFVALGVPSNDYVFFAQAAVGQNLNRLEVGTSIAYQPPFVNLYLNLDVSRVIVEETLGFNVDHWRLDAEVGRFLTPRLALSTFISVKEGNGFYPTEFTSRTDEFWFQHDRLTRHNYVNFGFAATWALSEHNRLTFSAVKAVHTEAVFITRYAVSACVSRAF
jgi:hypothetical protein